MGEDVKNSTVWARRLRKLLAAGLLITGFAAGNVGTAAGEEHKAGADPLVPGGQLWVMCTSDWGHTAYLEMYAACRAYIAAVADMMDAGAVLGNHRACLPDEATKGQVTEAVIAWMRSHPDQRGQLAAQATARALAQSFPCR